MADTKKLPEEPEPQITSAPEPAPGREGLQEAVPDSEPPAPPVPDSEPPAPPQNNLSAEIDGLDFGVEKSLRYHQRMRGHYDMVHKFMAFLIIVGGSAAFAEVVGWSHYLGAAIVLIAAIELVWGVSRRTRDHEFLHRRFSDLAILIRTKPRTDEAYADWVSARIAIESDEPPIYWAVEADCDNEVRRAWGRDQKLRPIGWWARRTMHIQRHAGRSFQPTKSA